MAVKLLAHAIRALLADLLEVLLVDLVHGLAVLGQGGVRGGSAPFQIFNRCSADCRAVAILAGLKTLSCALCWRGFVLSPRTCCDSSFE
ncbi:MAG: hypothetical protein GWO16_13935 [Gammaproteobacteria bacterium]|nr:hypothetical protein [Gammaproteobacteria bacterium]NIR99030.1 hypothetical protein [Gammaproteobacteria bacterium]NIT64656.1 hypothetical protein [Gammaproteobacteria bacterium]NIV21629.1 hypothetical protein [Gammaproteobacteria bacterium]NIY33236.1 hypothetical protein [Gammaproteobacteria bacterium]